MEITRNSSLAQLEKREIFLCKMRWFIAAWLAVWSIMPKESGFFPPEAYLVGFAYILYLASVTFAAVHRYKPSLSAFTFIIDSFAVTLGIYLTGGLSSPLWIIFLLTMISVSSVVSYRVLVSILGAFIFLYVAATVSDMSAANYFTEMTGRIFMMIAASAVIAFMVSQERASSEKEHLAAMDNMALLTRSNALNRELESQIKQETRDIERRCRQLEILYSIGSAVTSDLELDHILHSIIKGVQEGLGFDRVGIFEVDEEAGIVKGRIGVDRIGNPENIENQVFPLIDKDNNFAKIVSGSMDYFFTDNADETLPQSHLKYMAPGVTQNIVVPMRSRGAVQGMIAVDNAITHKRINLEDINLLMTFAGQAANAMHHARMYGKERETAVRLKKLEEAKRTFLTKMSHDLRTPLISINEAINFVVSGKSGEVNEQQVRFLAMARNNTQKLGKLIDEMLDSAKMEAKELRLEISSVDISSLIEEAVFDMKPQFELKKQHVKTYLPAERHAIHADRDRLFRVLSNLIGNAIKYTDDGGSITISVYENDIDVFVSVEDTGIGIDPDNLKNVFDIFYQVEEKAVKTSINRDLQTGVGLGLSIAREILEAHGGRIWAESEGLGRGSKFIFAIPKG